MSAPMPPVLAGKVDPRRTAYAIALCKAGGAIHHIPLFEAAQARTIAFTALPDRLSRPNLYALNKSGQPGLILVPDDDYQTTGPLGWAALAQMASWAKGALVHATGGDLRSYRFAVEMACRHKRLLLIETSSDAGDAWCEALHRADIYTLQLRPSDGVHPVDPSRGASQ